MKEILKNNLLSLILVIGLIVLGVVIAGNVYVSDGNLDVDNKLNVSNVLFVDSTSGKIGIGTIDPGSKLSVNGDFQILGTGNGMRYDNPFGITKWFEYLVGNDLRFWDSADRVTFKSGGKVGIGTTSPSYPLEVIGNVSGVSIWADGNVSASGFHEHTSVFDKSKGNALNFIKDADDLKTNGEIDHTKFYSYAGEFEVTDYSKPKTKEECKMINSEKVCKNVIYYPYNKTQGTVSLGEEISLLRQAVWELKQRLDEVCQKDDSYSWC